MAQTGTETQARAVACTLANSNIIKLFRVCIGIHAEGIYSHIAVPDVTVLAIATVMLRMS